MLGVVGRARVELGERMFEFSQRGLSHEPFERWVRCAFGGDDALVILQRFVELFLLRIKLGRGAEQAKISRFLGNARLVIGEQPSGHVVSFDLALFLFQRDGLFLVLQNVAVGAGAVFERFIAAFAQGPLGGDVFQYLRDLGIVGKGAGQLGQDLLCPFRLSGQRQRLAEFQRYLAFGRIAESDFQRQRCGARQVGGQRGVGEHFVGGNVARVAVEDLFGDVHGLNRV